MYKVLERIRAVVVVVVKMVVVGWAGVVGAEWTLQLSMSKFWFGVGRGAGSSVLSKLQMRGSIEDNSKTIFLFVNNNISSDPSFLTKRF